MSVSFCAYSPDYETFYLRHSGLKVTHSQTLPVPSMTSILLCYYYVVHLHFSSNPITPDDYNAI